MISDQMYPFPVDKIFVVRDERQRKDLGDLTELAGSMASLQGQLHPIIIERDGRLRTGERRWTAAKTILGWTSILVRFADELSEDELELLELDENIKRLSLSWEDECRAIYKYHQIKVRQDAKWTQAQTAEQIGMTQNNVSEKISVAKELVAGNERVLNSPKFSTAKNIVARVAERAASAGVAQALALINPTQVAPAAPVVPLLHADFHDWAAEYSDEKFNFIHTDFPYGVNANKMAQGQAAELGGYADGPEVYFALLNELADSMDNVVAESAHLIHWFSMDYYQQTLEQLTITGWRVNPFPLIWYKNDNTGILPDPQRGPRRSYETAFFGSRGDRKLTARGAVSNVCSWPGRDKSIHMSEKPVGMLKHFMSMAVDEYSRVLDPTAGSANALKAATELGAASVFGLERDEEFFNRATEAYFKDE